MNEKNVRVPSHNNNILQIYFPIPKFSIKKKVDFVTLSNIHPKYERLLYSFLESSGFKVSSDHKMIKGHYDMKRTYKNECSEMSVEIMHGFKSSFIYRPTLLVKIHDPNSRYLSFLDSFFKYHQISPIVSSIELTFDFLTDDKCALYENLKFYLFLKNSRTWAYNKYIYTYYANQIRRSTKGMRLYWKDVKKPVRLELVLKKHIIRKVGLEFPLDKLDSLDLKQYFSFMYLNVDRINNYLVSKAVRNIDEKNRKRKEYVDLLISHISTTAGFLFPDDDPLMRQIDSLKTKKKYLPNYSRFIEPFDDLNEKFFSEVSTQHFLT